MKTALQLLILVLLSYAYPVICVAQSPGNEQDMQVYDFINISMANNTGRREKPVIVAVIDDAFRLSHQELRDFIYINPDEIPGNGVDDDGNDYVDDVSGWDVSDNDNDVSVIEGRERTFYHGTYISSIITRVAKLHYGERASEKISIMPVKVIPDHSERTYLLDGYKGIKYAIDKGADIICLAWSGGTPGKDELKMIREAHEKGILFIASAGNFNEERVLYPAGIPEVLAVAGIDNKIRKQEKSNYGPDVDISAPAHEVKGAHPEKDNAYIHESGTSTAAALVAGCAAVIMSKKPGITNRDIEEALLNASTPFSPDFQVYGGKLGAGIVNLEKSIEYIISPEKQGEFFSPLRPKGTILINRKSKSLSWKINPAGAYHGFYLSSFENTIKKPEELYLTIHANEKPWKKITLSEFKNSIFVPANSIEIRLGLETIGADESLKFNYHGKTIDSTRLYCSDTKYFYNESGTIEDGSGKNHYSNNCSCKWLIKVPDGKRIKFTFQEMDTQPNVDFVYLVDGKTAIPENFIAKFSGQNLPPVVVSKTNEVLVWFVSDKSITGQGWRFQYEAVE